MISVFRLLLLFLMTTLAGQAWGVGALSVEICDYDAAIYSSVEAETLSVQQRHTYDGFLILPDDIGNPKSSRETNPQNGPFIVFVGDFVVTKSGTTVIGRVKDLQNLKKGEQSLLNRLPDRGSAKANWKQNSGVIRQEISKGKPIRDASAGDKRGQFLNAERNLLESRGWTFDKSSSFWNPPKP